MYGREEYGTFSLVACDAARKFWGVAVSTMPLSVGAVVPWAEAGVGALATQARSNIQYGPLGLGLLRRGLSADEVVARLTRADARRQERQLGVVDRRGKAAAWTGKKCMESATHVTGDGFTCQGNIVASEEVVHSMARAFGSSRGTLASRMLSALRAGAKAGGDRRGIQSAALLVVHRERWLDPAWGDHWTDIRVDQHAHPIDELGRILRLEEAQTRAFLAARRARLARLRRKRAA